jgi:hypothetical protein
MVATTFSFLAHSRPLAFIACTHATLAQLHLSEPRITSLSRHAPLPQSMSRRCLCAIRVVASRCHHASSPDVVREWAHMTHAHAAIRCHHTHSPFRSPHLLLTSRRSVTDFLGSHHHVLIVQPTTGRGRAGWDARPAPTAASPLRDSMPLPNPAHTRTRARFKGQHIAPSRRVFASSPLFVRSHITDREDW